MSKLQDNRTTPQFMAMLEKWAFFLTLNLHFQQIRFLSLKMQLEIRHFSVLRLLLFLYFGHLFCLLRNMRSRVEISLFSDLLRHTVFENHRKCLIQHCQRNELRLHLEWRKVNLKMPKMVHFDEF